MYDAEGEAEAATSCQGGPVLRGQQARVGSEQQQGVEKGQRILPHDQFPCTTQHITTNNTTRHNATRHDTTHYRLERLHEGRESRREGGSSSSSSSSSALCFIPLSRCRPLLGCQAAPLPSALPYTLACTHPGVRSYKTTTMQKLSLLARLCGVHTSSHHHEVSE
jgi:hypothetical protein